MNYKAVKRAREREPSPEVNERYNFQQQAASKRAGYSGSFYIPCSISDITSGTALSANCNYKNNECDSGKHNVYGKLSHSD